MEQKRQRTPNFSLDDSYLLLDLVEKFRHIIENKKTDVATCREKEIAWMDIAKEFNKKRAEPKPKESLKMKYNSLKKEVRRNISHTGKPFIPTSQYRANEYPRVNTHSHLLMRVKNIIMVDSNSLNYDVIKIEDGSGNEEESDNDTSTTNMEYLEEEPSKEIESNIAITESEWKECSPILWQSDSSKQNDPDELVPVHIEMIDYAQVDKPVENITFEKKNKRTGRRIFFSPRRPINPMILRKRYALWANEQKRIEQSNIERRAEQTHKLELEIMRNEEQRAMEKHNMEMKILQKQLDQYN